MCIWDTHLKKKSGIFPNISVTDNHRVENALSRCFYHDTVIYPGVYHYYVLSHLCFPFLDHYFISSEIKIKKNSKNLYQHVVYQDYIKSSLQYRPWISFQVFTTSLRCTLYTITRDVFPENTETNIVLFIYPPLWFISCVRLHLLDSEKWFTCLYLDPSGSRKEDHQIT